VNTVRWTSHPDPSRLYSVRTRAGRTEVLRESRLAIPTALCEVQSRRETAAVCLARVSGSAVKWRRERATDARTSVVRWRTCASCGYPMRGLWRDV
jgi:hypothetical protein